MYFKCSNILRRSLFNNNVLFSSVYSLKKIHSVRGILNNKSTFSNVDSTYKLTLINYTVSRAMTSTSNSIKNINIEDYLKMREDACTTIIDVREKSEIADTGILPGAINIPVGDVETALQKDPDSFEKMYLKQKPSENDRIIFSCRSGKRSAMAAGRAQKLGYENVLNLSGGWLAWEEYLNKKK